MIEKAKINLDDIELDLIDGGANDIYSDDELVYVETAFTDFGAPRGVRLTRHTIMQACEHANAPHVHAGRR